ncbi:nuclear transport factor 2 family protein [Moritella marina ATCC 15381]|uniref:Nuclear transport factor 2 family protein n=1 Tax=Moritella marina ATCC 15381 TaxID=1202962 RepID=A0A5J6WI94_MORMI|nr:nuclear transport factor 2 family protein [Moritella marina]QFI36948.1 nuclear transport factor 2 family protein [Moritella marina ATCC 15381]
MINTALNDTTLEQDNSLWLSHFIDVYTRLNKTNLHSLKKVYHHDIKFQDPLHEVAGIANLVSYFENLYTNLASCTFDITHQVLNDTEAAIYWDMTYIHPKLNRGKAITVSGHSHLKALDDKVIYHRDYLDVGAMLYEHVPVLGHAVRYLKNNIA